VRGCRNVYACAHACPVCAWLPWLAGCGVSVSVSVSVVGWFENDEPAHLSGVRAVYEKVAATYFPACYRSIIGAEGLNFSVRDGKRWTPSLKPPSMS
jgi:hypothetical protein